MKDAPSRTTPGLTMEELNKQAQEIIEQRKLAFKDALAQLEQEHGIQVHPVFLVKTSGIIGQLEFVVTK